MFFSVKSTISLYKFSVTSLLYILRTSKNLIIEYDENLLGIYLFNKLNICELLGIIISKNFLNFSGSLYNCSSKIYCLISFKKVCLNSSIRKSGSVASVS